MAEYTVVVATGGRPEALGNTIRDWQAQSKGPKKIVVVDCMEAETHFSGKVPVEILRSPVASAARQRNLGAEGVETEWLVFSDDDVRLGPELAVEVQKFIQRHSEAVAVFPDAEIGASHARALAAALLRLAGWQAASQPWGKVVRARYFHLPVLGGGEGAGGVELAALNDAVDPNGGVPKSEVSEL